MLESCAGYNVMYYNPSITYTPWLGENQAGNAYVDQSIGAAKRDPYYTSSGTIDLRVSDCCAGAPGYFPWVDTGVIGLFEAGECADTPGAGTVVDYTQFIPVTSMNATDQTNFANWYSYYRKREYVVKRSLSEIITNSVSYMGLATLHNNNSVGTPITDMTTQTNKNDLLDELFQIDSSGGTPLRRLLENTGEYYDQAGSNSDHSPLGFTDASPIQNSAGGGECQQNFAVIFTDGAWNGGSPSVGNADGDDNTIYDGGPNADNNSNTLADVAMDFYERDLSTTLANNIPENVYTDPDTGVDYTDDNPQQHMITYGVAFGLAGSGLITPLDHDY